MTTLSDGRQRGWYHIDNAFLDDYGPLIGVNGVAIYNVLARRARDTDKGRVAFPSYSDIAARLGISRPTVITTVRTLIAYGLVTCETVREGGKRPVNHYRIVTVIPGQTGKGDLPVNEDNQSTGKGDELVNDTYQSTGKADLPVNEVYQSDDSATGKADLLVKEIPPTGKTALPEMVKDFDCNKTELTRPREQDRDTPEVLRTSAPASYPHEFEVWWAACPARMRRCGKSEAYRAWKNQSGKRPPLDAMLRTLALQAASGDWQREGGKYIPMATTYLSKARWEAEVPPDEPMVRGSPDGPTPYRTAAEKNADGIRRYAERHGLTDGTHETAVVRAHAPVGHLPAGDTDGE